MITKQVKLLFFIGLLSASANDSSAAKAALIQDRQYEQFATVKWHETQPDLNVHGVWFKDMVKEKKSDANYASRAKRVLSSMLLLPSIKVKETYNDNIYATETTEIDSFITTISPSFVLTSDWEKHSIRLSTSANIHQYSDTSSEDAEDARVVLSGHLDVTDDLVVSAHVGSAKKHEDRFALDRSTVTSSVVEYAQHSAAIGVGYHRSTIGIKLDFDYQNWDYSSQDGIDNGSKDKDHYTSTLRLSYAPHDDMSFYVEPSYQTQDFTRSVDTSGVNRDADRTNVLGGVTYNVTELVHLDLAAGYSSLDMDSSALSDNDTVALRGVIVWNPHETVTVTGKVTRDSQSISLATISNITATDSHLLIDYAFRDNILFRFGAGYQDVEFEGSTREDDTLRFEFGSKYLMNDHVTLTLGYRYADRDSNAIGESYSNNIVYLNLGYEM